MALFRVSALLSLALAMGGVWGALAQSPASPAACAALAQLTLSDVTIAGAEAVPAGPFTPPGARTAMDLPAFCRVIATAKPTADSLIRFEVWLPLRDAWNGKFEGVGTHAFQGALSYDEMAAGLTRGYAVASTDTGHVADDLHFADGHPEKVADWAWRAIHVTAEKAKLIVRDYEGRFASLSYFDGCDTGGHEALMEAQRFPGDYDGIVAGTPAADRTNELVAYPAVWRVTHDASGASLLPAEALQTVTQAATAACDGDDGVKDGVIENPRRCKFDAAELRCKAAAASGCLTNPQIAALKAVYAGVHNPRTGALIFPGWSVSSEGWGPGGQGWSGSTINSPEPRRTDFYRYFVFNNAAWDWHSLDLDKDVAYIDAKLGFINAIDPDMTAYARRGGKIVMYTGWIDPILPAEDVINYYDAVGRKMGAKSRADFLRLFMVPGMGHCGGGPGPSSFDMLTALEQWIEHGKAPIRIPAAHIENKIVIRTRPLCAYPQVAHWSGKGSSDDAANFACKIE